MEKSKFSFLQTLEAPVAKSNGNVAMGMNKKTEAERARNACDHNNAHKSASNVSLPKMPMMPTGHMKHQQPSDQVVNLPRLIGATGAKK